MGAKGEVTLRWREGMVFEGAVTGRPAVTVDADSVTAMSPVELLLLAAASCTAADVVSIMRKQRVELRSLEVAIQGTRREAEPRRFTALHFRFTISGAGAGEAQARRAIDLSLQKYCSVVASLAPDTKISYDLSLR
ncbi:MAG TPA: OsmC family protein [Gemmatimonadales bacterium]|nr:OsmC family protein [Gemmatimonadales bacterium]